MEIKKFLFRLATLAILLAGCASQPPAPGGPLSLDLGKLTYAFDVVNQEIHGKEFQNNKGNFSSFSLEKYRAHLVQMRAKPFEDFRKSLTKFELQDLSPHPQTFVYCVYSQELKYAMCDDARCTGVERKSENADSAIIARWKRELPSPSCGKYKKQEVTLPSLKAKP